jgi:peptide-methionine (R)-S-oxide reductase
MKISRRAFVGGSMLAGAVALLRPGWFLEEAPAEAARYPFALSDAQWRARLTAGQYRVLRQRDTEAPFSSPLNDEHKTGTFQCAGCAQPLFSSRTKFDSHSGWPSFWQPLKGVVRTRPDHDLGMERTEVLCARCGGHLGHVFNDGPEPTGKRYCMNGVAMRFIAA